MLGQLAPAPRPVPVAATLLTLTLTGMVVLGMMTARRTERERQLSAQPPEASAMVHAAI